MRVKTTRPPARRPADQTVTRRAVPCLLLLCAWEQDRGTERGCWQWVVGNQQSCEGGVGHTLVAFCGQQEDERPDGEVRRRKLRQTIECLFKSQLSLSVGTKQVVLQGNNDGHSFQAQGR